MPIYEYVKSDKTFFYYAFEVKDSNGKRKTIKQRGFSGRPSAKKAEALARAEWEKGIYIDPTKLTFGEYINDWLSNKQDLSEQSRYTNEGHIRNHILPSMGSVPLSKLNTTTIEKFVKELQEKGLKDGTVKKIFNFVNTSLNAAAKKGIILRNPINLMDTKPRVMKPKMDYWSKEEVKQFLNKCDHRLKILFILAIHTGMRRGEMLGLRFSDVDFENAQIRIRQILGFKGKMKVGAKTNAGNRSISIPPNVLEELKKHRQMIQEEKEAAYEAGENYTDNDLIICSPLGANASWGNFHKFWVRAVKKAGVRQIRFHDLRHTCSSLLLQTPNVHPKVVQELLGHSSIKITLDTYSHLMPNMQAEAVKAMEDMLK